MGNGGAKDMYFLHFEAGKVPESLEGLYNNYS